MLQVSNDISGFMTRALFENISVRLTNVFLVNGSLTMDADTKWSDISSTILANALDYLCMNDSGFNYNSDSLTLELNFNNSGLVCDGSNEYTLVLVCGGYANRNLGQVNYVERGSEHIAFFDTHIVSTTNEFILCFNE